MKTAKKTPSGAEKKVGRRELKKGAVPGGKVAAINNRRGEGMGSRLDHEKRSVKSQTKGIAKKGSNGGMKRKF